MTNTDAIKRNSWLISQYFNEVWNKGKVELLDELIAPAYLNHSSSIAGAPPGPEGLQPIVIAMRKAFPDLCYEIKDLIITPDRIVARVVMTGTHQGDFFGLAPTGQKIKVDQVNIEYVTGGKITEHWRITDELSLMKQLEFVKI
ncbi:MAG: ester cyclase [Chitinophagaceae bacterium]